MKFNDIYRLKKRGKKDVSPNQITETVLAEVTNDPQAGQWLFFSSPITWSLSSFWHNRSPPLPVNIFFASRLLQSQLFFLPYWTHFSFLFDVSFFISPKASECWNIQRLNPCIFFMSSLNLFHPISVITDVSQYSLNVSPKSEAKLHTYLHSDI